MAIGLNSHTDGISGAIQVAGNDVVPFNTSGLLTPQITTLTASVASNALTVNLASTNLTFKSTTVGGTPTTIATGNLSLTVPNGSMLGMQAATSARLAILALNNAGTVQLGITNIGTVNTPNLDETSLISTYSVSTAAVVTASIAVTTGIMTVTSVTSGTLAVGQMITGSSITQGLAFITALGTGTGGTGTYQTNWLTAISSETITTTSGYGVYSSSTLTNVAYRVVGFIDITEATSGVWATAPTNIQGIGGQALAALSSIGYGQTWQNVTASRAFNTTYYNTTGKPITVNVMGSTTTSAIITLTINDIVLSGGGSPSASVSEGVFGIVPPGGSYISTMTGGTPTLAAWSELR